jgi:hypothetical protein
MYAMSLYHYARPLKGRDRMECEAFLQDFYNFLQPWGSAAIDAYLNKNPQSSVSRRILIEILQRPEKSYEVEYYAVLREVFMLEGKKLEDCISSKVREFWEEISIKKSCLEQEKDIQFYLSP